MSETKTYRGQLRVGFNGEEDVVELDHEILADTIEGDIDQYGHYLTVRYFVADQLLDEDQLAQELMCVQEGYGDAEYRMCYSEITGYLWTDEKLIVGGHNLLEELDEEAKQQRFLHMEITYNREPSEHPFKSQHDSWGPGTIWCATCHLKRDHPAHVHMALTP